MYTPKFNQIADRDILIEAMRAYSFAHPRRPAIRLRIPRQPRSQRTSHWW